MLIIKQVILNGKQYPVTISDDSMALQAAYAAGGAIIGIWRESEEEEIPGLPGQARGFQPDFSNCLYLVTSPEAVDEKMLERVVRRRLHLPWLIGETKRLIIREFACEDPTEPEEWAMEPGGWAKNLEDRSVFCDRKTRAAYIENQYRFHECGLWALVEKESKTIIGKAGVTGNELAYHIYPPYRRSGYGLEACKEIVAYAGDVLLLKELFITIKKENLPSDRLASRLTGQGQNCACVLRIRRI